METNSIRIFNEEITFIGEVDNATSFFFIKKWEKFGEFEIQINNIRNIIKPKFLIMINNDPQLSGVIEHIESRKDNTGEIIIKGFGLGCWFSHRITVPPIGQGYTTYNTNIENIMFDLVDKNAINPVDKNRKIPKLILGNNQHRGEKTKFQTRYKVLSDELTSLSKISGLGWIVELDVKNKQMIFKILEGKDLSTTQNVNPPMIFCKEYDNILEEEFILSNTNFKSMAYIGGQGEEENRQIELLFNNLCGLERREIFIDARDISENESLIDRGKLKLAEYKQVISYSSKVTTNTYKKNWNLGDIVTIKADNNISLEHRIIEVKEIWNIEGHSIEPTFGDPLISLTDKIKQLLDKPIEENGKVIISTEKPISNVKGTQWKQLIN